MKKMKKGILLGTMALILTLGVVPIASVQASAPPPSMQINNGDTCTTKQQVTLNTNIQWKPEYSGTYKYRVSETSNLVNLPWRAMTGSNIQYTLSAGYGRKTVYLEVLNSNNVILQMSDSIDYRQSCVATQASIKDLTLKVVQVYREQRFKFDVKYDFYSGRTDHDNTYQIEIKVIPEGHTSTTTTILGKKTFAYTASQEIKMIQGAEYRHFTGTLQVNAPAQGVMPFYRSLNFNVEVKGGPDSKVKLLVPLTGGEKSPQKFASKRIIFVDESYSFTHNERWCTGPSGYKRDMSTGQDMRAMGWMLGSIELTLNRARGVATQVGEELKFDSNPLPGTGERGVRWKALPYVNMSGKSVSYEYHYWCEPYSNKKEGNAIYEFRFTIKYKTVEVKIP